MQASDMARIATDYGYTTGSDVGAVNSMQSISGNVVLWIVIAAISLIGGLVLYFTFLSKRNEGKYKGFLGWTYEFLNFKRYTIEAILKSLNPTVMDEMKMNFEETFIYDVTTKKGDRK